jgi:hypothetical protein
MEQKAHKLKRDKYKRARGGSSRLLNLYCANCKEFLLLYQKDGSGTLKRLYLDRIFAPDEVAKWQKTMNIKEVPNLVCGSCKTIIGTPYVYEKENRHAILLNPHNFIKKISK